jgi:mercuric ion transport protein
MVVVALAVVGIAIAVRKRRRASCRIPDAEAVDLDMPTLRQDLQHRP